MTVSLALARANKKMSENPIRINKYGIGKL